jgi:hypothetical protein
MNDDYKSRPFESPGQGESDQETDDDNNKTVDMLLEAGLATQPEDDDSKCDGSCE